MRERLRNTLWIAILCIVLVLVVWHAIYWHYTGFYLEMFEWLQTGKEYITVLYNLGLMLALGISLGFLMERIIHIIGYEKTIHKK